MTRLPRRLLPCATTTVCALGFASGALAAQASAATIAATQACYVNANPAQGAPMTITGAGFAAGDPVTISGGTVFATATAGADCTFAASTQAPILPTIDPATEATALTATDENTGATATTSVMSANLAVSVNPSRVRHPDRTKVTFKFSGFIPGRNIYAFYLRGKKVLARAKFGKAAGPCGTFQQKALMYPGGHPRFNQYKVAFESSKRYSKTASPLLKATLNIIRF